MLSLAVEAIDRGGEGAVRVSALADRAVTLFDEDGAETEPAAGGAAP